MALNSSFHCCSYILIYRHQSNCAYNTDSVAYLNATIFYDESCLPHISNIKRPCVLYGEPCCELQQDIYILKGEATQRISTLLYNQVARRSFSWSIFSAKIEMMAREIDLLTRGSGHLGFCALVGALEAGYHVHAAVQTQSKADLILAAPSINALKPGPRLESVIVSDTLAHGAYDKAVKGVLYCACRISYCFSTDGYERDLIEPAIKGTIGSTKSAAKAPSMKQVVITSSELAVIPWEDFIKNEPKSCLLS